MQMEDCKPARSLGEWSGRAMGRYGDDQGLKRMMAKVEAGKEKHVNAK